MTGDNIGDLPTGVDNWATCCALCHSKNKCVKWVYQSSGGTTSCVYHGAGAKHHDTGDPTDGKVCGETGSSAPAATDQPLSAATVDVTSVLQPTPPHFLFKLNTDVDGVGVVVLNITREWAPLGVDRLWALIADHFFDDVNMFNSFQYSSYDFTLRFDRINIFQ